MIIVISVTLFFIVLRFTVTLFNFLSNPKLTRVNRPYNDLVSIMIPARNEEDNILTLLRSISQQDYTNYEVIVYDDNSTDKTYEICLAYSDAHPKFSVISGSALPSDWTGKNFACFQLAKKARGSYFLFIDADTIVTNGLINSAVYRVNKYKLALLSLFPNQIMQTMGEKTTVPFLHYMLLNLLPLRLIYLSKSTVFATACGQFMLFEAAAYQQNQWHEQVKGDIVEDAAIMRQLKAEKYKGEVLLANGMISCRMYKSYTGAVNGFSKNFLALFNYSILGLLIYVLLLIAGPMIVIMTLNWNLILFMSGLIILTRIMIALAAGQKVWYNVILHPLQLFNLVVIAFLSIHKHLTKTIIWKGRRV